jgi:hypothetical protein
MRCCAEAWPTAPPDEWRSRPRGLFRSYCRWPSQNAALISTGPTPTVA